MATTLMIAPAGRAGLIQCRSGTNYQTDTYSQVNVNTLDLPDLILEGFTYAPSSTQPLANFRNILDGGDFTVNPFQRNVPGLASGNALIASITSTPTYFADRWFAVGGVASAIQMGLVSDASIPGFSQSLRIARQSGVANTATMNFGQVLESADAIRMQGQPVTFSLYVRTGSTYSGGALTAQVISGTGANQSAASMVAGTWTGQTVVATTAQQITSTMTRYTVTGVVPAGCTQLGVLLSFTPSGTAGIDDSITVNGLQLEAFPSASPFEHRDVQVELEICQRYAWVTAEPGSGVIVGAGMNTGGNSQVFYMATPVTFKTAPTVVVAAGAFKTNQSGTATSTTITAGTTHTINAISVNGNSAGTAGQASLLQGGGGSGYILASCDF